MKNKYHRDGSITYWSVYQQCWLRSPASEISDAELAAMPRDERRRIERIEEQTEEEERTL